MKSEGFTLVELVVIIILLGIIAAVALPAFFNLSDYRTGTAYNEVAGAVRYAQKLAVASGCEMRVVIERNNYNVQQRTLQEDETSCGTGGFTTISNHPVTSGIFADVTLSPSSSFIFDSMGRCSDDVVINVGDKSFRVVAETGSVDAQ